MTTSCRQRRKQMSLGQIESRFADIIWSNEPITTSELVKLAQKQLTWKRTTTYTILKRLCEKGLFVNTDGMVTSLISKEDFYAKQSEKFVNETFDGSLPAFIAAFSKRKKLSEEEINKLQELITKMKED
ncbi:MAG: BlaI/MecI/CopY family transcriptional regulator [Clostridia bacterium]|nr:BlaI/MecI/CopY family transcriptional regulator [Clostridia bacterium]